MLRTPPARAGMTIACVGRSRYGRDVSSTPFDAVRRDYDASADDYDAFVREPANAERFGEALIGVFADLVRRDHPGAIVIDAGCGPGQHTDRLDRAGLAVRGVDLSPAMIEIARRHRPDLPFAVGSMTELDLADGAAGAVFAHYSIIHIAPDDVPAVLAEFARVLAPGGYLLLGFQSGDAALTGWAALDHKVATAYRWSIDAMSELVAATGLHEITRLLVQPYGHAHSPAAYLVARSDERATATGDAR